MASVVSAAVLLLGLWLPLGATPASAATPVMGPPVLSASQLAAFYNSQGRTPRLSTSIESLARFYIEEGRAAGVRGDIAFVQAIHETNWFEFGGDVTPDQNNFAGIGATGGGEPGNRFATPREGVRAQIHHLRAYADPGMVAYKDYPSVDPGFLDPPPVIPTNESRPRFTLFSDDRFGSAPTWEGLTGTWAADPAYTEKIMRHWRAMLLHAGHTLDGAVPIAGDWDGNGSSTPGFYYHGRVYLTNSLSSAAADLIYSFGRAGDVPVVGDWNGDGRDTLGVIRDGRWYVKFRHGSGSADRDFAYGRLASGTDYALAGDWDGDGRDTPGIVRDGDWHLRNVLRGGAADIVFRYGRVQLGTDVPLTGDWNGNGRDTPAIVRAGEWHVRFVNRGGAADRVFQYGRASDIPVSGDWNGNGSDTPGVVRGLTWHLRNTLSGGGAHVTAPFSAQ